MQVEISKAFQLLKKRPSTFLSEVAAFLIGTVYWFYFNFCRTRITIRFPFYASARVRIKAIGSVSIGRNCYVRHNTYKGLDVFVASKDARVVIGDNCSLGGVTIYCSKKITIGDNLLAASTLIQDCLIRSPAGCSRHIPKSLGNHGRPIKLGDHVWLAGSTHITSGAEIGRGSVVSQGAVVFGTAGADYQLIAGNYPNRVISIRGLGKFFETNNA